MAKELLLSTLSILSILSTSLSLLICSEENLYQTEANPGDATSYYICLSPGYNPSRIRCPEDLVFNPDSRGCSYIYAPSPGSCPTEGQVIPVQDGTCTKYKICKNIGTSSSVQLKLEIVTCNNTTPIFDPFLGKCVEESDYFQCRYTRPDCDSPQYKYQYLAAPGDWEFYYDCSPDGVRMRNRCTSGQVFDVIATRCIDKIHSVYTSIPLTQDICKGKAYRNVADPNYCRGYYYCVGEKTPYWKYCQHAFFDLASCTPMKPEACKCEGAPAEGKTYVRNSAGRTKYLVCQKGKVPIEKECPFAYVFDADAESCVSTK